MFPIIVPREVAPGLQFRCHKVPAGTHVSGWLIGPIITATVHWSDSASKPCLFVMSNGQLDCPCQHAPKPTRDIGYVPLLTPRPERICVIVSSGVAKLMLKSPLHSAITLWRSNIAKTALTVTKWDESSIPSDLDKRIRTTQPVDIRMWLLHLWSEEQLCTYFAQVGIDGEKTKAVPTLQFNGVPIPVPREMDSGEAARRAKLPRKKGTQGA